jgi:response regulator RpfG family c-di-GMP phosphodiesterase
MSGGELPRVLCVDDDARLLEGLTPHLRRDYRFQTATGGEEALQLLEKSGPVAVVVSDMRMPGMDGASFLGRIAQQYPNTTRLLLTGDPGRDGAVRAINEGQIYRFLTKPCPPHELKAAINAGVRQHELVTAEKILLQETLLGSIKTLVDVLAMLQPAAFGRAGRLKRMALEVAADLGRPQYWQLETAALLSQLGYLSLPQDLVEKYYAGARLTPEEKTSLQEVPRTARRLLGSIPRLDSVLHILDALETPAEAQAKLAQDVGLGARILSLVLDYDMLVTQGSSEKDAVDTLKARGPRYDQQLLEVLARRVGAEITTDEIKELPLRDLLLGMVLLKEVRTEQGALLVPQGFEVTTSFLERMRNFAPAMLNEPVKVMIKATAPK